MMGSTEAENGQKKLCEPEVMKSTGYFFQRTNGRKLCGEAHSHDFYEVIYVISGGCTHRVNGGADYISEGEVIFLRPCDFHSYKNQLDNTAIISLSVSRKEAECFFAAYGDAFYRKIVSSSQPPILYLSPSDKYELVRCYEKIALLSENSRLSSIKVFFGKIAAFFIDELPEYGDYAIPESLAFAIKEMYAFENAAKGVKRLTELSRFSSAQLGRLMKKHTGKTPHEFVFELRMNMAHELITSSDTSLSEIADSVGYASFSHFNKVFTAHFGKAPGKVKKESLVQRRKT